MKRFFALLVCLCLVLGMVPSGVTFTANAETNDALVLDDQSQALCPVCNQTVTWTPINNKGRVGPITDGGSQHFYLAEDVTAANAQFAELSRTSVCLNLNGKKLVMKGRIQLYSGSAFHIFGEGDVTFNGDVTSSNATSQTNWRIAAINIEGSSTVSLYGGTYSIGGQAATDSAPFIRMTNAGAAVNVLETATVNGKILATNGNLLLSGKAVAKDVSIGNNAKLTVDATWSGLCNAAFSAALVENMIPEANGVAAGEYTGSIFLPDGRALLYKEGRLLAKDINAELKVDDNGQALCPVCDEVVTWLDVAGQEFKRIGPRSDGGHHHFYLSEDVVCPANAQFAEVETDTTVCFHLNGKNLTYSGRMRVGTRATLNIMGSGLVTYEGDCVNSNANTQAGYNSAALEATTTTSTINLLGGTYVNAGLALESGKPVVNVTGYGACTLQDAVIKGKVNNTNGTVTLAGSASVDTLAIGSIGKLIVEAGWEGFANATFVEKLTDGALPEANAASTGSFPGGLQLHTGEALKGENGLLVVNDNKELLLTEDDRGYCQTCDAMVSWTPIKNVKGQNRVGVFHGPVGTHHHFYMADDNFTALKAQFMEIKDVTICLHLNGNTVSVPGRMWNCGGTVNIMGDGKMDFLGSTGNEDYDIGLMHTSNYFGNFNLYGGTYTSSTGKPVAFIYDEYQPRAQLNLLGDVNIDGFIDLDYGKLKLTSTAKVSEVVVRPAGRIIVDKDWIGTATASFINTAYDGEIAAANGECNGDFVGGLKLTDGRMLSGRNGRLVIVDANELRVNAKKQGYCQACDEVVTWTPVQGDNRIGYFDSVAHQHYYLSGDLNCPDKWTQVLGVNQADFCLHLNGHNMTHGGRIYKGGTGTLSIMGDGNVTFTATTTSPGTNDIYIHGGIFADGGKVNLYGGTYQVAGKAAELGKPTIYTKVNMTAKDAVIHGQVRVEKQTFIVDGTTTFDNALICEDGRLSVLKSWMGSGVAAFEAPITGNLIPASNGVTNGVFAGKLTMADGRELTRKGNNLLIGGDTISENLTYRIGADSAELVAYAGEGNFLLPTKIAGKPVTAIAEDAFANFNGELYIGKNNTLGLAYAQEKNLAYTEVDSFTLDNGVVQLQADADSLTFEQDTYLDLNGYNVANVTVTAGTLFVLDSKTDDYSVADGIYGKITNITGAVQAADGYLKVTQDAGVSFHCVTLEIDAMTLRSEVAGVYYKSTFAGDEIVASQVQTYGVTLSVNEDMSNSGSSAYHTFTAGVNSGSGTLLKNVMKANLSDRMNSQRAQMPVYGRPYILTADGCIFGETVCRDTKTQIEMADRKWDELTKVQRESIRAMYETYQSVMENWDVPNMQDYVDRLWYTTPAADTAAEWEEKSLPIGNGYSGTSVFGGTETETLSITEETMFNPATSTLNCPMEGPDGEAYMRANGGGFANLCKVHLDFGHAFAEVTNYERDLVLDTAEAHVSYDYDGVTYNRTYFASYPDNVTVMKLDASESGKLTFTLRPVATYVRDYCVQEGDGMGKTGTVSASGDTAIVSGQLTHYGVNYEAQFKVIPVGGTMTANEDGTITVTNADSAMVLVVVGTNYVLSNDTFAKPANQKLDRNSFPHEKLTERMNAAAEKTYEELRAAHRADHQQFYNRVEVELGGEPSTTIPTDQQMAAYRAGGQNIHLEEMMFQYGRYLLIASSRDGSLPANLQGVWNYYCSAAWAGQYVYNINLPMTYWPAFNTNLVELFKPNVDMFEAFYPKLQTNADRYLETYGVSNVAPAGTGGNGVCWSTAVSPYVVNEAGRLTHSGPGAVALTTQLYWDYYDFSRDEDILEQVYPFVEGTALFLSKTLKEYDGKWLVANSASPENNTDWNGSYYITVGTAFDQQLTLQNYLNLLEAARVRGLDKANQDLLATIETQIDKLDPVVIGKSGQVKEYREEEYYGELGEYYHRHLSQLMGLFPGNTITAKTPAWLDAARYTLQERGLGTTGWSIGNRINAWARTKDGNGTHYEIQYMLKTKTRDNLWGTHPPFQIECNFGYTAGLAEMLVQSHEGFIEVLPALPDAWATGSYKGLTARGGFEVDVAWENGTATEVSITSNTGEELVFKYCGAANATVVDSKGNPVSFTSEGSNLIRFATTEGETYTITNLGQKVVVEKPADLKIANGFNLTWKASSDAVSYKVYRAVNSQATYDLIAEDVTGTTYSYNPTDLNSGDQVTIRITAVNADGVESDGIRAITWVEE